MSFDWELSERRLQTAMDWHEEQEGQKKDDRQEGTDETH